MGRRSIAADNHDGRGYGHLIFVLKSLCWHYRIYLSLVYYGEVYMPAVTPTEFGFRTASTPLIDGIIANNIQTRKRHFMKPSAVTATEFFRNRRTRAYIRLAPRYSFSGAVEGAAENLKNRKGPEMHWRDVAGIRMVQGMGFEPTNACTNRP